MEKYLKLSIFVFLSITFLQCQSQQEKKVQKHFSYEEFEEDLKKIEEEGDITNDFFEKYGLEASKTSKDRLNFDPNIHQGTGKKIYFISVLWVEGNIEVNKQKITKEILYNTLKLHFDKIYPKKSKSQVVAISFRTGRGISYEDYMEILDIIKKIFSDFQNIEATKQFGKNYDNLSEDEKKQVKEIIPLLYSEGEPL